MTKPGVAGESFPIEECRIFFQMEPVIMGLGGYVSLLGPLSTVIV